MEVDDNMRDVIASNLPLNELRRAVREKGMRTLRQDGMEKIAAGMTTIDELVRVTET
jgi:type II secretory ATPase GspE/PulE/Tfp pilus assembly ATPase PilB-like protein